MPLPDLETLCVELTVSPQRLSLILPGGASLDAPLQLAKQLMAQANAALAPLVPVFDLVDVALALANAVKAIPDAIEHLDPSKISAALPALEAKLAKVLALVPQLSVPIMIVGLIDVLLAFLEGLGGQLGAFIDQQVRIQRAENRAAELGNAQLQIVAGCAKHHLDAQLLSLAESVAPVNRLVALVNVFAELAGLGPLPGLGDLGHDVQVALASVNETTNALREARAAIPL
jgi:hypothetical protein